MKLGWTTGGRSPIPPPAAKAGSQACKVVHGKMELKGLSFSINSVLVNESPAIFGAPIRKCEQTVLEKVLGALRRLRVSR